MKIYLLLIATSLLGSSILYAKTGSSIQHMHENRAHTHPLPTTGLRHTHNSGKMLNNTSSKSTLIGRWYFVSISNSSSKTTDPSALELDENTPYIIFDKNNRGKMWETSSRWDERTGRAVHSKGYGNITYKVNGGFLKIKSGNDIVNIKYRLKNHNKILEISPGGSTKIVLINK